MQNNLDHIIYMKFGYHALETENDIIRRKKNEVENTGVMYWGYGGTICHPLNQVQPFVEWSLSLNKKVYLAMSFTPSKPTMDGTLAKEFSYDSINWHEFSINNKVTGSKYAIVCKNLQEVDIDINLTDYKVALGPSKGKNASDYIKYRVDKGCLIKDNEVNTTNQIVKIRLLAELKKPFAIILR